MDYGGKNGSTAPSATPAGGPPDRPAQSATRPVFRGGTERYKRKSTNVSDPYRFTMYDRLRLCLDMLKDDRYTRM